jgi:hypothetical protein
MVPVGLGVAEVLSLIASSLFVLINNCRTSRDVILNVFERQVELKIILLRSLLGSCICWREWIALGGLGIVQGSETLVHRLRWVQGLQPRQPFLLVVLFG